MKTFCVKEKKTLLVTLIVLGTTKLIRADGTMDESKNKPNLEENLCKTAKD